MDIPLWSAAQCGTLIVYLQAREVQALGGGTVLGGRLGSSSRERRSLQRPWSACSDGCLAQSTREKLLTPSPNALIHLQENWKRLSHFSPWLFMIIHIFKWKGKKAKKETLKWAKKEKKKFSEKNFRGKSCSILKSFEGCKVPRFSHLLHTFFSDFFSMFNICEMTAFLYLKLDASRFVGRGWWYSRSLERESLCLKGCFLLGTV